MDPDSKTPLTSNSISMVSSTSSVISTVSSDGLVVVNSVPGSSDSSPSSMVERVDGHSHSSSSCSTDSETASGQDQGDSSAGVEEADSVDGLVLMGSTRLRPAPEASSSNINKANLYLHTFKSMFGRQDCTSAILPLALHGNLQNNPFRSFCWRVLLNVLPTSSLDWSPSLRTSRKNYEFIQNKFQTDLKLKDITIDPLINNPLSQAEESPWNQHFQDGELKKMIKQDVIRTFPEVDFFQSTSVRDTLVNILFLYARCHPELGYRQGMHELLAPLYYVVKADCDTFQTIFSEKANSEELEIVHNEIIKSVHHDVFSHNFTEPDTFTLFEALMEAVGPWFMSNRSVHNIGQGCSGKPWSRPQDQTTGNKLVDNLNYIQDVLLRRHDPTLFARLEKLEIFPQIYGIRWLRLLFGREFLFKDTLLLWDAIFADSCPPRLCDQLVVSLLMAVRDLLLRYDYQDAVQLLMKLPSNLSVTYCTQLALHLKDPIRFPRPGGSAFDGGHLPSNRGKRPSKYENKHKHVNAAMTSLKSKKGSSKISLGVLNDNRKPITSETHSEFTVLDLQKDVSFHKPGLDIVSTLDRSDNSNLAKQSRRVDPNIRDPMIFENDIITSGTRSELLTRVTELESLLRKENLVMKSAVFEKLTVMKTLIEKIPESSSNGQNVKSKHPQRTASVAVDVSTYFEEE